MSSFAQRMQLGPFFQAGELQGGALLWHYAAGTVANKDIWSDRDMTAQLTQPFEADADGIFNFFADGLYDVVITTATGDVLYTLEKWQVIDRTDPTFGEGSVITSSSTIAVGPEIFAHIGGSTNITVLTGSIPFFWAVFDGDLTLVNSSNLLLPDNRNRKMRTGDIAFFLNEGAGVWRLGGHMQTEGSYTGRYGATVAASTTLAVPTDGDMLDISGATPIEGIATAQSGYRFRARFTGAGLNIIYNATSMQCPFETDYRTSLNEIIEFLSLGASNWLVIPQAGAPQLEPGTPFKWWGTTAPKGAVLCDAAALNCTTYYGLAKRLVPNAATLGNVGTSVGTFTVNTGTDVLTRAGHGLAVNDIVHVTNAGGGLPAPFTANTVYFVKTVVDADNFTVSATRGGAVLDITTAGSGTQTVHNKVNAPEGRGRVWIGIDGSANVITAASVNGANADTLGGLGGAETHTLQTSEMPAHGGHTIATSAVSGAGTGGSSQSLGGGGAHSNTQPWIAGGSVIRF